jgi:predicted Zn finger-like uncharacterized protein
MYAFCPACSTLFAIKAEHLLTAAGRVRCGACGQVFRAFDYVYEDLATAQAALADFQAADSSTPVDTGKAAPHGDARAVADDAALLEPAYAGAWGERSHFWRNIGYAAVIVALLLLLALQWLYFNRARLAADNDWRPRLERLCSALHCDLPLRVDRSRIELINRDVRKHPQVKDALLINATFVNHAGFRQPYPILAITFLDTAGTPIAARRFKPAEYLGDKVDIGAGMPPDAPLQVVLEIEDPGEEAVSFQFEFL